MTPELKVKSHDYNVHVLILILVPNTWTLSIMGNGKSPKTECTLFLAPLAVGQRAYVMARCLSSVRASVRPCVRPSVRALTFSLNIFFAETTYRILMKFHRNVPTMVLFRIS